MFKKLLAVFIIAIMFVMTGAATEVRGEVKTLPLTGDHTTTWTADNFAALYFDIDNNGFTTETLTINGNVNIGGKIDEGELTYTTTKNEVVNNDDFTYNVVGWMGERYVAVGGRTNKIAKLIYDMEDTDKATLTSGNVLDLGEGYTLTIVEVDAKSAPRQAWIQFKKDGVMLDDGIVDTVKPYEYKTTVLGDEDVTVFHIKIVSIFVGQNSDMIQMKYGWLIDQDTAKEIKGGDSFGSMEVETAGADKVVLTNHNSIGLSKDSTVTFMGNMKFRVSKDGKKFYPKIDIVNDVVTILPTVPVTPVYVAPIEVVQSPVVETITPTVAPTTTETSSPVAEVETPVAEDVPVAPVTPDDGVTLWHVAGAVAAGALAPKAYSYLTKKKEGV